LKDGPAMTALIEKAVAAAKEKAGGELPGFERVEGKAAWRLRQDETEVVGFAVQGKTLVLTTGVDKLDAAMARLAGGDKAGKSLGDRVMVAEAKAALSPENNLALFISVPVLFSNYPLLNLWPPAAPAKLLAEAVVMTRVSSVGIKGEVLVTLPPPPPPEPGEKK